MSWISNYHLNTLVALLGVAFCFGGSSSETVKAISLIYLVCSVILVLIFSLRSVEWVTRTHAFLLFLLGSLAIWLLIQLLPIGGELIANDDRDIAVTGLTVLGHPHELRTISFFPERGLMTLVAFSLPMAVFTLIIASPRRIEFRHLIWAVPLFGAASSLLGLAQVVGGVRPELYFYANTNMGETVGVFANVNHQACFLVITLPFAITACIRALRRWNRTDSDAAIAVGYVATCLVIVVGAIMTQSLAGYALLIWVFVCFVLKFLWRFPPILRFSLASGGLILAFGALAFVMVSNSLPTELGQSTIKVANDSRIGMNLTGLEILQQHWLLGTGPGTVAQLFPLYEDAETVSSTFVNHLHNDYLEWAIEAGLPGILILLALLAWIASRSISIALSHHKRIGVQFAAFVSVWVPIFHSAIDYPLRNPSIVAFTSVCLAVLSLDFATKRRASRTRRRRS